MADLWVMKSQNWVNSHYKSVAGVTKLVEDGQTGWGTMYALTRALQHELGIASPSDSFGPATKAAFQAKIGTLSSKATNVKVIALLQCALWCKGFSGGSDFGTWSEVVDTSITAMRVAMGLSSGAVVDDKMMKSLFTLDAYVITPGGSNQIRSGQQWMNSKYASRRDFNLVPCDGHFTRDVQSGLMLALQFELGMADGVANGNFGPGTQAGLKAQATISSGSTDALKNFVSLFQIVLAFNGYDSARSGTFTAATKQVTLEFQKFLQITATGIGDLDTWWALLVSTGNPDRKVTGIDTTTQFTKPFAEKMRKAGYSVVGRYLTVKGKSIGPGELDVLFAAGFSVVPIFQNMNNAAQYFSKDIGKNHGVQAALRARQLGFKEGVTIFFPVDYDAYGKEVDTLLVPYFVGIAEGLASSALVPYKIGVYGTRNIAGQLMSRGVVSAVWVSGMSSGFSGNLGFPMPAKWSYNQIQEDHDLNIDRNAVSSAAKPATRADVDRTPDQTDALRTFYFNMVRLQVLAEATLPVAVFDAEKRASRYALFFLMSRKYTGDNWKWSFYTPVFGKGALETYFKRVATIEDFLSGYPGDLEHMAATAQAVIEWGDLAGQKTVEVSDLGGWALDFVQLWASYKKSKTKLSITAYVDAHLGTFNDENGFDEEDLIADSDGWLIGRDIRDGKSFSESVRVLFLKTPHWPDRLALFLAARFGATNTRIELAEAISSVFADNLFWPAWARDGFLDKQRLPVGAELSEFTSAAASRLSNLAGLD